MKLMQGTLHSCLLPLLYFHRLVIKL